MCIQIYINKFSIHLSYCIIDRCINNSMDDYYEVSLKNSVLQDLCHIPVGQHSFVYEKYNIYIK